MCFTRFRHASVKAFAVGALAGGVDRALDLPRAALLVLMAEWFRFGAKVQVRI